MQHTQQGKLFTEVVLDIFKVNGLLATEGDRLAKEYGLSSARWKVLGALIISTTPLTVSQIAREMGLTRQAVQRLTDVMEKGDLVAYQTNPHHKRAKYVVLTNQGKESYAMISAKQIPWANLKSKKISEEELHTTLSVLRKLTSLLEP